MAAVRWGAPGPCTRGEGAGPVGRHSRHAAAAASRGLAGTRGALGRSPGGGGLGPAGASGQEGRDRERRWPENKKKMGVHGELAGKEKTNGKQSNGVRTL